MRSFILFSFLLCISCTSYSQLITLDELRYFQSTKSPFKIDSVLSTKKGWNCGCLRAYDKIEMVDTWFFNNEDYTDSSQEKDKLTISEVGMGYASVLEFTSRDTTQINLILDEIADRKYPEKIIEEIQNDSVDVKLSIYIADDVAIQSLVGKNGSEIINRSRFYVMDKKDYLNGLIIK